MMKVIPLNDLDTKTRNLYKNTEWSEENLDACLHYIFAPTEAMVVNLWKIMPFMTTIITYLNKQAMTYRHPEKELQDTVQYVIKKCEKNLDYIRKLHSNWQKKIKKYYTLHHRLLKTSFTQLSNKALIKLYCSFYRQFTDAITIPFFIEAFTVGNKRIIEENFQKYLEEHNQLSEFAYYFSSLTWPEKPSFFNEATIDLLKIIKEFDGKLLSIAKRESPLKFQRILGNYPKTKKEIEKYSQKYSWVSNSYGFAKENNWKCFFKEAKYHLKKGVRFDQEIKELRDFSKIRNVKNGLYKKLLLPLSLKNQLKLVTFLASWQDERKRACFHGIEMTSKFLDACSRRTNIKKKYLKYSTPSELEEIISSQFDASILRRRSQGCLAIWDRKAIKIILKPQAYKLNKEIFLKKISRKKGIVGIPASVGKASGRVKILLSSTQGNKMKKGDILVAGMTRPDYLPAIRKAAAIVTDEGGITCHAAIVSREFGIPCIIATKIATQVLKDGDWVEVDAEAGVVKKIESLPVCRQGRRRPKSAKGGRSEAL